MVAKGRCGRHSLDTHGCGRLYILTYLFELFLTYKHYFLIFPRGFLPYKSSGVPMFTFLPFSGLSFACKIWPEEPTESQAGQWTLKMVRKS
jgi:hypothetical protein